MHIQPHATTPSTELLGIKLGAPNQLEMQVAEQHRFIAAFGGTKISPRGIKLSGDTGTSGFSPAQEGFYRSHGVLCDSKASDVQWNSGIKLGGTKISPGYSLIQQDCSYGKSPRDVQWN